MSDDLAAVVAAAWGRSRPTVLARLEVLSSAIAALGAGELGTHERGEALGVAHKLAGSLGMYGFAAASELAARVEAVLDGADGDLGELATELLALRSRLVEDAPGA